MQKKNKKKAVYHKDYKTAYSNTSSNPGNSHNNRKRRIASSLSSRTMQHSEIRLSKKYGTAQMEPHQKYFYPTLASIS